jgi:hypothetical protein
MAPFRTTRAQLRPWVAMVAAYAVVLQMLFAGIAVASVTAAAAGSSGDPFVIATVTVASPSIIRFSPITRVTSSIASSVA